MTLQILQILLGSTIIGTIIVAIVVRYERRKKISVSIDIIYRYAQLAERLSLREDKENDVLKYIRQGKPFNEHDRLLYSPILFSSSSDNLSLKQIIKICHRLNKDERKSLLEYFSNQTLIADFPNHINTDYFRSLTQERKEQIYKVYLDAQRELKESAKYLVRNIQKSKRRQKRRRIYAIRRRMYAMAIKLKRRGQQKAQRGRDSRKY